MRLSELEVPFRQHRFLDLLCCLQGSGSKRLARAQSALSEDSTTTVSRFQGCSVSTRRPCISPKLDSVIGRATQKWMSSRPGLSTLFPIVLKATVEMRAAQCQDRVSSPDGPEHS